MQMLKEIQITILLLQNVKQMQLKIKCSVEDLFKTKSNASNSNSMQFHILTSHLTVHTYTPTESHTADNYKRFYTVFQKKPSLQNLGWQ